jgi:hypothetical protein
MVYFAMAMALLTDHDYEEVATLLTRTNASWGCWDDKRKHLPLGITQARKRLGSEPLRELASQVASRSPAS